MRVSDRCSSDSALSLSLILRHMADAGIGGRGVRIVSGFPAHRTAPQARSVVGCGREWRVESMSRRKSSCRASRERNVSSAVHGRDPDTMPTHPSGKPIKPKLTASAVEDVGRVGRVAQGRIRRKTGRDWSQLRGVARAVAADSSSRQGREAGLVGVRPARVGALDGIEGVRQDLARSLE